MWGGLQHQRGELNQRKHLFFLLVPRLSCQGHRREASLPLAPGMFCIPQMTLNFSEFPRMLCVRDTQSWTDGPCVCECSLRLWVSPSGRSLLPLAASHPDLREDLCLPGSSSLFSGTRDPRPLQALCGALVNPL